MVLLILNRFKPGCVMNVTLEPANPEYRRKKKRVQKSPTRIIYREKQRQALELRKMGYTYRAIAEELGYANPSSAYNAVNKAWEEVLFEPAQESWQIAVERLHMMLLSVWDIAQSSPNHDLKLKAIDRVLSIQKQINDLTGVEAPKKVEHEHAGDVGLIVIDGSKEDYIAALSKMAGETEQQALPTASEPDLEVDYIEADADVVWLQPERNGEN